MTKIKIAHIISNLTIGGTQKKLQVLLDGLERHAFEHLVINLGAPAIMSDKIRQSGILVEDLRLKPSISTALKVTKLTRAVRLFQPDIIQGWLYPGNVAASVVGMITPRAATVWHVANMASLMKHEPLRSRVAFHLSRFLSWQPEKIVYVGHAAEKEHNRIGFPHNKGLTIRNGFDTHIFRPLEEATRARLRLELGIRENELAIGMIARFSPVKNHAGFIAAMALLKAAKLPVRGVFLGSHVDMQNPAVAKAIEKSGNSDHFLFLGEHDDIAKTVACLDIAVNCSFSEGLPRSIAEAMACGVPAAVTDVGDSRLLIGDTGALIVNTTPIAIADGLLRLIKLSHHERSRLGELARARIIKEFSAVSAIHQHAELYRTIAS